MLDSDLGNSSEKGLGSIKTENNTISRAKQKVSYWGYHSLDSDDELIPNYYQIEAELQGTLDNLEGARRQATRHELREASKDYSGGGAAGGFAKGFAFIGREKQRDTGSYSHFLKARQPI